MKYRALVFAAGRGARMRPLTDHTSKPLLTVQGKPLIIWQIEALARAGFSELVVNTAWHGAQVQAALGDGGAWGVQIRYSHEATMRLMPWKRVAASAMRWRYSAMRRLSRLAAISSPTNNYRRLYAPAEALAPPGDRRTFRAGRNPPFHLEGDFAIREGRATRQGTPQYPRLNYGNIACWHPALFAALPPREKARLFPWADSFVAAGRVTAEHHRGVGRTSVPPMNSPRLTRGWALNLLSKHESALETSARWYVHKAVPKATS